MCETFRTMDKSQALSICLGGIDQMPKDSQLEDSPSNYTLLPSLSGENA